MIDPGSIEAIISQYSRHGWTLRRVLLSERFRKHLDDNLGRIFSEAEVADSNLDALWFSRSSRPGAETWELRRLSNSPYALDAFLDDSMENAEREEILRNAEERLRESSVGH
jgi:hypothetical protein